jgi:hypothetical protein
VVHLKGFSPIGLFPFIMSFAQHFLSMQLFFTKQIVWPSIHLSKANINIHIIINILTCFVESMTKTQSLTKSCKYWKNTSNHKIKISCKSGWIATLIFHIGNQFLQQIVR